MSKEANCDVLALDLEDIQIIIMVIQLQLIKAPNYLTLVFDLLLEISFSILKSRFLLVWVCFLFFLCFSITC